MTAQRIGDWIETNSGIRFYPADPRPNEVRVPDIIHAICHLCRWGGHCDRFWSVGQHSILVWRYLRDRGAPPRIQFLGLIHDFTEGYVVDLPTPVKSSFPAYRAMENRLMDVITESLGLRPWTAAEHECVKHADTEILHLEAWALNANKTGWAPSPDFFYEVIEERPSNVRSTLTIVFTELYTQLKSEVNV